MRLLARSRATALRAACFVTPTLYLLSATPAVAQAPNDAPVATPQYREVRPPVDTGRRGLVSAPSWVVWATAGVGAVAALGSIVRMVVRRQGPV